MLRQSVNSETVFDISVGPQLHINSNRIASQKDSCFIFAEKGRSGTATSW